MDESFSNSMPHHKMEEENRSAKFQPLPLLQNLDLFIRSGKESISKIACYFWRYAQG
jgi:hypothetical protein